jgi:Kef-type K+ transport system membrane component KefB
MKETQILGFLVALAALLGAASIMGAVARRIGCAAVVGEILAGIVIGKTVLGRVWPEAFAWLFRDGSSNAMLQGYKTVAIVLLLVVAGLEIDTRSLRRTGKALVFICLLSALLPFVFGYGTGLLLPDHYLETPSHRELHALFLGIALAISALPVITRTLMDLGLMKTDIGVLVLSAAVVNDIVGWICFSALVRAMGVMGSSDGNGVIVSIGLTTGFLLFAVLGLRPVVDRWLRISERAVSEQASTSRALSMVMVLALLGAVATEMLGIHAVFGGFAVGLAIGSSRRLRPGVVPIPVEI